eukprot:COSAG01_NODE_15423_length_1338_cov_10.426957_1_plen_61_part_10
MAAWLTGFCWARRSAAAARQGPPLSRKSEAMALSGRLLDALPPRRRPVRNALSHKTAAPSS